VCGRSRRKKKKKRGERTKCLSPVKKKKKGQKDSGGKEREDWKEKRATEKQYPFLERVTETSRGKEKGALSNPDTDTSLPYTAATENGAFDRKKKRERIKRSLLH